MGDSNCEHLIHKSFALTTEAIFYFPLTKLSCSRQVADDYASPNS